MEAKTAQPGQGDSSQAPCSTWGKGESSVDPPPAWKKQLQPRAAQGMLDADSTTCARGSINTESHLPSKWRRLSNECLQVLLRPTD